MPRCTRKGCGKDFAEAIIESCVYHPGSPVFHEGLKSWSCCSDVNKPVLDFNEFMSIPGCAKSNHHTTEAPQGDKPKSSVLANVPVSNVGGKETFTNHQLKNISALAVAPSTLPVPEVMPTPVIEEEDDLEASVEPGTACKRKGCGIKFVSDAISRIGDGEGTVCIYHPSPPIFREGSKGYLCCKRRVLEFDEFLKIKGCKTGRHVFVPRLNQILTEEMIICRIDHYQTLDKVHVSVYGKQADKQRSKIRFEEAQITVDLHFPSSKRFLRVIDLFGPIDPDQSTVKILGTKVELNLQKKDNRSWTVLEKTNRDLGNITLTFGVGGRTGTVGAKEVVLDETNKESQTLIK